MKEELARYRVKDALERAKNFIKEIENVLQI